MFVLKKCYLIFMCVLLNLSAAVSAHELNGTSAHIILRDGQVEVKIITDTAHLAATLQSDQAWLTGDIEQVMPGNLSINDQQSYIKNMLLQSTQLQINNQAIKFERALFNTYPNQHDEIVLLARHKVSKVSDVSLSFSKSLGAVHANIVKPQYKLLNAGEALNASF